jgi:hypothetical protein
MIKSPWQIYKQVWPKWQTLFLLSSKTKAGILKNDAGLGLQLAATLHDISLLIMIQYQL